MRRIRWIVVAVVLAVGAALVASPTSGAAAVAGRTASSRPAAHPTWATQLFYTAPDGQPWSRETFAALRADGMNTAEINLGWDDIEPARNRFDFAVLDAELANAAAAGVKVVPIFWQSQWGGNPARWITNFEVSDTGDTGNSPAWWDRAEQRDYFHYVTATVAHLQRSPAYGGAVLDYGWLDAQWHEPVGNGGYAPADVAEYHRWLPTQYGTVARFNRRFGTTYSRWAQVPAARVGDATYRAFQEFRVWSVEDTYGRLTAAARGVSDAPLFYYFGGHLGNARDYANLPDIFFRLARRYDVTVIEDAADSTGLSLLFGSLAERYHVRLMQEWTARDTGLAAEAGQWLVHYGFTEPAGAGEDFFIHDGTDKDTIGYPIYRRWLPRLKSLRGSYPRQPVAVYVSFATAHGDPDAGDLGSVESQIGGVWGRTNVGFSVVTDEEVRHHVVDLSQFRAVLPLNGVDRYLRTYAAGGGQLLTAADQLTRYARPYATLSAAHVVEAVPTVAPDRRSAQVMMAAVNQFYGYDGSLILDPRALGLRSGRYHLVAVDGGAPIPQRPVAGGVCAPLKLQSADLLEWDLLPGPAPAGTPVPARCPAAASGPSAVSNTVGAPEQGLRLLLEGASNSGADGDLTLSTVDGEAAAQTRTIEQSGAACGCANAYLQLDPNSRPARSSTVTITVRYFAAPGQGFQVQYDGVGGAYEAGPTVHSPGTNAWVETTVTLTDAAFDELQNESADLRLQALDPHQPLTLHRVNITAG